METYPLNKTNRLNIAQAFAAVPRVDMSIECVIEGTMGRVLVDDAQNPTVFQIRTGPFAYFAGDPASAAGQKMLRELPYNTLLMPSTSCWIEAAQAMYPGQLMEIERSSFSSESLDLDQLVLLIDESGLSEAVRPVDADLARSLRGQNHFIDLSDYDSVEDFVSRGAGFYIERDGEINGAAYASLACSKGIEVSVFVREAFRRQGIATVLSAHLLRWCLARGLHPNWDAANQESCRLAEKLGYTAAGQYKAHWF